MRLNSLNAALIGIWILAAGIFGYMSGLASVAEWTLLAAVALAPVVLMLRLRSAPAPTMSETIRKELR